MLFRSGTLREIIVQLSEREVKGELVFLIGRATGQRAGVEDVDAALRQALRDHRMKDAAAMVAEALGLPKRDVYQRALKLSEE